MPSPVATHTHLARIRKGYGPERRPSDWYRMAGRLQTGKEDTDIANNTFIDPSSMSDKIAGRGRKPSDLAEEVAKRAKGCPVDKGFLMDKVTVSADNKAERGRVRSGITTGAKMAGWTKVSVSWTTDGHPLVVRSA